MEQHNNGYNRFSNGVYVPDYNCIREFMEYGSHDELCLKGQSEFDAVHDISLEDA